MMKQAAAAIALGMAFAAVPLAHADDNNWMALAISDSTGKIQVVYDGTSQDNAVQTVMSACRKTISDCRLLASGQGGCVAIAMPPANTKYFGGWGPTREEAEAAARANSAGGRVLSDHTHCQGDPAN
jgi:hypothetical protein